MANKNRPKNENSKGSARRNNTYRNNKYSSKRRSDKDVPNESVDMKSETNDPGWYEKYGQLIEDAAHINFSWPAGMLIPTLSYDEGYYNANLMALHSIPTIDYSAARTAMWTMYAQLRQVNSGAKNYTPEDLFAALINGTQIYSALNWAIRFYTMANMFNGTNRSIPYAFFEAENADYASFVDNRADYRAMLNTWIIKFGTISLPNFMPVFAREAFLYQNVYTEGTDWKDQMYMFVPDMFWATSLDYTTAERVKSQVVKVHPTADKLTPVGVNAILTALYENTVASEFFNIISGDLAKLYPNNLIQVSLIGEDLSIAPIYDERVLEQIKNAKVYNVDITTNFFTVSGTDFMYAPQATLSDYSKFANDYKDVITTVNSSPSAVDITELTRLVPHFDANGSYITAGSDIIRQVDFITYKGNLGTCDKLTINNQAQNVGSTGFHFNVGAFTQFKFCPNFTLVSGSSGNMQFRGYVHNIDNFGIIAVSDLQSIHYAALLNLYYVPVKNLVMSK